MKVVRFGMTSAYATSCQFDYICFDPIGQYLDTLKGA